MTTYLELLSSILVYNSHLGADLIFWSQIPPPPWGGPPGGLFFGGTWVVATFLKVLSSNLVSKPHLGANFDFEVTPPPHPPGGFLGRGEGGYFGGSCVVTTYLWY